jgi:hypothetical protein
MSCESQDLRSTICDGLAAELSPNHGNLAAYVSVARPIIGRS